MKFVLLLCLAFTTPSFASTNNAQETLVNAVMRLLDVKANDYTDLRGTFGLLNRRCLVQVKNIAHDNSLSIVIVKDSMSDSFVNFSIGGFTETSNLVVEESANGLVASSRVHHFGVTSKQKLTIKNSSHQTKITVDGSSCTIDL